MQAFSLIDSTTCGRKFASIVLFISSLRFDRLLCGQRSLLLTAGAAQLCQRNVLQLTNALPRDAKILTDIFQGLRLSTVETEALRDDFLLATVEHCDEAIHYAAQILVAQP